MRVHIRPEGKEPIETVDDVRAGINTILPGHPPEQFPLLKFANPNAYAAYRPNQMDQFIEEWDRLAKQATRPEVREVFRKVRAMAQRVRGMPGHFLWFEGDLLE